MNTNEVYTPGSSKVSTNAPGCLCDECEHCEREIRAIWLRNMNEFDKQHGETRRTMNSDK